MGAVERRRGERLALRNRIIKATLRIIADEGWDAVTIRRVATSIEYTQPIVYEHFENKENLQEQIIIEGHKRLYKTFAPAIDQERDAKAALMSVSLAHWRFAFENRNLYRLMFDSLRPIPNETITSIGQKIEGLFLELASDDLLARELMFNWMCLVQGYTFGVMKFSIPPELSPNPPDVLFQQAIGRFLGSIGTA